MNLKHLEQNIQLMEESLNKMKVLTKEVEAMDDLVDIVRSDLHAEADYKEKRPLTN
jgi:hypothetical protein